MFKKFFRGLAESKEQKQQARYLKNLEEFAVGLANQGAPALADTVRRVAKAKQEIDASELVDKASKSLEVDFDQLATNLCDRTQEKFSELAKLHRNLPAAIASADKQNLSKHLDQWQAGLQEIQIAYAALKRTAADKLAPEIESLTEGYDSSTPVGQAVETLLLEVRTAERIRNELG